MKVPRKALKKKTSPADSKGLKTFKNILIGLSGRVDKFLICILIFLIAIKKIKIHLK
jgi:hypothetical protein